LHPNDIIYLPGSQPKRVRRILRQTAQVQHPFSMATAIGGRKMAKNILQTSEQVTVILRMAGINKANNPNDSFWVILNNYT